MFLPQAIEAGDLKLIKIIQSFCDFNKADADGYTPLLVVRACVRACVWTRVIVVGVVFGVTLRRCVGGWLF